MAKRQAENFTWERRAGLFLAFVVVIFFIYCVVHTPKITSSSLAIIRFLAALASGFSTFLFLGSLDVEAQLPIPKVIVRSTGAFAAFITVFLLFLHGISDPLLSPNSPTPIPPSAKESLMTVSLLSQREIDYSTLRN